MKNSTLKYACDDPKEKELLDYLYGVINEAKKHVMESGVTFSYVTLTFFGDDETTEVSLDQMYPSGNTKKTVSKGDTLGYVTCEYEDA